MNELAPNGTDPIGRPADAALEAPEGAGGQRPRLSIVVATSRGLPYLEWAVAALRREAEDVGAELVVADSSGNESPPDAARASAGGATETWISIPGMNVAALRQVAYERARGEIIAVTEDHCEVEPGWARAWIRAHDEDPEVAAVGGAVLNASTESLVDWGSFYVGQFAFMPPFGRHEARQLPAPANASYKRSTLDRLRRFGQVGAVEILDNPALHDAGEKLVVDDSIRVRHKQGYSFLDTSRLHFHSARVYAGARRQRMDREGWLRGAGVLVLPLPRLVQRAIGLPRKEQGGRALAALPMVAWVLYVQALGELVGYAVGPGKSARRLL